MEPEQVSILPSLDQTCLAEESASHMHGRQRENDQAACMAGTHRLVRAVGEHCLAALLDV